MLFPFFGPRSLASLRPSRADRLRITGKVERDLELGFDELSALPAEFQIPDVGRYADGIRGRGVRLAGVLARAGALPHPMYLNAGTREGEVRVSLFRREVEPLGIVLYAREHGPLPAEEGGPFRLILPGFHDGARDIAGLAWIEIAKSPGPDNRKPSAEDAAKLVIGNQTFDPARSWFDPREHGRFVIPPPNG